MSKTLEKRQPLLQIVLEKLDIYTVIMKLDSHLSPYTKIILEWIKDLNINPDNLKLLKGNRQRNSDIEQSRTF